MIVLKLSRLSAGVLMAALFLVVSGIANNSVPAVKAGAVMSLAAIVLALLAGAVEKVQGVFRR